MASNVEKVFHLMPSSCWLSCSTMVWNILYWCQPPLIYLATNVPNAWELDITGIYLMWCNHISTCLIASHQTVGCSKLPDFMERIKIIRDSLCFSKCPLIQVVLILCVLNCYKECQYIAIYGFICYIIKLFIWWRLQIQFRVHRSKKQVRKIPDQAKVREF